MRVYYLSGAVLGFCHSPVAATGLVSTRRTVSADAAPMGSVARCRSLGRFPNQDPGAMPELSLEPGRVGPCTSWRWRCPSRSADWLQYLGSKGGRFRTGV